MRFADPLFLLFLPLIGIAVFYVYRYNRGAALRFSHGGLFSNLRQSWRAALSEKMIYLRLIALVLIVFALARPRQPLADSFIQTEGVDIILALDSSTSMLAEDFKILGTRLSRIDIIKDVVADFIKARQDDRIGLITFAGRAYTLCPPTLDYPWLLTNLERVKAGMVEDGTAIGSGIATALNRLKNSTAKSKVVILLTDGRNNMGSIAPLTAAETAKALKIKIYTIGAGSKGPIPYPVRDAFGNKFYQNIEADLDEGLLSDIAKVTGAKYYRATDTQSLRNIYLDIDRLEKTPLKDKGYREYNELFPWCLLPGLFLILLEIVLTNTVLRRIP
jgi:Ca-activated chloride channel homolog